MPTQTPRRPSHQVQIQFSTGRWPEPETRRVARLIRAAARATLDRLDAAPGALTVRLVGDAEIRRLNRDFLDQDAVTDVLSFPADQDEGGRAYFGDLAISAPRARAQARAGGHELGDELRLLVVHGVLHLLGLDHDTSARQKRMWRAQAEILTTLGSAVTSPKDVHR